MPDPPTAMRDSRARSTTSPTRRVATTIDALAQLIVCTVDSSENASRVREALLLGPLLRAKSSKDGGAESRG